LSFCESWIETWYRPGDAELNEVYANANTAFGKSRDSCATGSGLVRRVR